jgi:predicted transcriptional regulator
MDKIEVKEIMRPISEFSVISGDATFMEGMIALENVDEQFKSGRTPERILLVQDKDQKIIGKISPMDIVQGLEPKYDYIERFQTNQYYLLIENSFQAMEEQSRMWNKPLSELCEKANSIKIKDFIKMPTSDHIVMLEDALDVAFHVLVSRRLGSLFVKNNENIVGLILFSDIYKKIKKTMKSCTIINQTHIRKE